MQDLGGPFAPLTDPNRKEAATEAVLHGAGLAARPTTRESTVPVPPLKPPASPPLTLEKPKSGRRLLLLGLVAAVLMLVGVVPLINYLVNPLSLYRDGKTPSIAVAHTGMSTRARVAKPLIVSARNPTGVVTGDTSAESGFDPQHPYFGRRGYNGAVSGGSLRDSLAMAVHTSAVAPNLQSAAIVIDPLRHLSRRTPLLRTAEFSVFVISSADRDTWRIGLAELGQLFSIDQLGLSFNALAEGIGASSPSGPLYLPNGQRDHDYFARSVAARGNWALSRKTILDVARNPVAYKPEAATVRLVVTAAGLVRRNGVKTVSLVVGPVHAALYAAGEKASYFDTATLSIEALASELQKSPRSSTVALWDCSILSEPTSEPIAAGKGSEPMRWWWDVTTIRNEFGNRILDEISGTSSEDVCVRVDLANPAGHSARRAAMKAELLAAGARATPFDQASE